MATHRELLNKELSVMIDRSGFVNVAFALAAWVQDFNQGRHELAATTFFVEQVQDAAESWLVDVNYSKAAYVGELDSEAFSVDDYSDLAARWERDPNDDPHGSSWIE